MKTFLIAIFYLISLVLSTGTAFSQDAPTYDPSVPKPTLSEISYGEHERQVIDFWEAESKTPTPLVFVIHGGGWQGGTKERVHRFANVQQLLDAGISVVAINYRLIKHANEVEIKPPVKAPLHDAARALQFVRSKAVEWNIDKNRIGAAGGSAGACSSLWLAYHDDLADPESKDPIAHESTRLWCAAVVGPQTTLDPKQMKEWTPNSKYGGHAFGKANFEQFLAERESILPWIAEYSPYAHVSADDPPVYLLYNAPPALGQNQKDPTHTANFGVKLKERCDSEGIACELQYPGAPDVNHKTTTDYLISSLKGATGEARIDNTSRQPNALFTMPAGTNQSVDQLKEAFKNPPNSAKPGVYWYFMDGNLSRKEMTKDLESMKEVGISNLIFLEVGIGVPRGSVDFMSEEWQELYVHAVREAERLGIKILLGAGPGWCGSGGPWVKPEESMKHLVFSETEISGNKKVDVELPMPEQRSTTWHTMKDPYYEDVAVYAIPNSATPIIEDINEKALYERDPYSSKPNVKPYLPAPANYDEPRKSKVLEHSEIINVTEYLQPNGHLVWDAPKGKWTIIRMGKRVTGASTRPSPEPVIGLEANKMSKADFASHLKNYTDILLEKTAPRKEGVGWTGFHMDSWESGAQNWTEGIVGEFIKRRGYDPEPYFLTYTGRAVTSVEVTERFLWDLRQTCKELLLENHVEFGKAYAHKNGLELTIEPYDMNPAGDLDLGAIADVIMAEFWSKRFGYHTSYAVLEATSISHITGKPIVGAEVFTSNNREAWQEYPWSMKDQSDWALALGVNRFVYHTFAHKPLGDEYRPGMTMGQYGVHWDRGQTWWPMVEAYHKYISRSSHMMQQGQAVADILYLTPEGAPMVFTPPADALKENGAIPDKRGYGFDGCSPKMLMEKADVENGKIVFPGASSYELLVLPNFETMTPELLKKITFLVEKGAKIIGTPPVKSPSLMDYPNCDNEVKMLAEKLWGSLATPEKTNERKFGDGTVFWGGNLTKIAEGGLYPTYKNTVELLSTLNIHEDFKSGNNTIRFGHRKTAESDIYFVANRTDAFQTTECTFRAEGEPELWIGTTGETRQITDYTAENGTTTIPLEFFPYESFFVTFSGNSRKKSSDNTGRKNFPNFTELKTIEGSWNVSFDPAFGGPENIEFDQLQDWTKHDLRGIKYYSGIVNYTKTFTIDGLADNKYYIDLGVVKDIARVKLNGTDVGVIWCAPWRIDISGALKEGENKLEIEVANRWVNRLLGDRQEPDANVRTVKFENGLMGGKEYTTGRYTFTTKSAMRSFNFTEPLSSGLLGPVTIFETNR